MRHWMVLSLLGVLSFGIAAETLEGPCKDTPTETSCCACLCHVPMIKPAAVSVSDIQPSQHFASAEVREARQLFDKSFFRPPRPTA